MKLERLKGTRDFLPEQMILRQRIVDVLRATFELYGFQPLETPVIEMYDVLASKCAGGAEILKETYKLTDQGKRRLALRYDLTVPLARFMAQNPQQKMPFKRYQIGPVFRDGPIKAGRYREFYQCDADVVGSSSMMVEAECLQMAIAVFKKLGIEIRIAVNNRKILDFLMEYASIPKQKRESAMLSIDKLEKLGKKYVAEELKGKGIKSESITSLLKVLDGKGTNNEKLNMLKQIIPDCKGVTEIEELFGMVNARNVVLDISLARGLSYYTSTIFEGFANDNKFTSSIFSGGRYDEMIGKFIGKGSYPAAGISFGLDIIYDIIKGKPAEKTMTKVYVIPINTRMESFKIAEKLRKNKINTDIDLIGRGISKNLDYANRLGIPYVLFVGRQELEKAVVKLRDMRTGKEENMKIDDVIKKLSS